MVHGYLSLIIVALSVLFVFCSFYLLKKVCGVFGVFTISLFFLLSYLIFSYIGSVLLNVFYFQYELNLGFYNRPDLLFTMWVYSSLGLLLIPFGMVTANIIFRYKPKCVVSGLISQDVKPIGTGTSAIMFFTIWGYFLVSIIVLFIYRNAIGDFPIMGLFKAHDRISLSILRSNSGNNFQGKHYIYMMFIKNIPSFLLILTFFMRKIGRKFYWLFCLLFCYNIFVSIMSFEKAPLVNLFVLVLTAYLFSKNMIDKKTVFRVCVISMIVLIIMYAFFMDYSDKNLFQLIEAPLQRIFIGQIHPFFYYFLYQEKFGYIYGASFPNPAGIFPFKYRKITEEIYNFAYPKYSQMGIVGSVPTVFYADWFINFGLIMALFSMFLIGLLLQSLDIYFINKLSSKKTVIISTMFIYMINYMSKFTRTSYVGIIFDQTWMVVVFVAISISFIVLLCKTITNGRLRLTET